MFLDDRAKLGNLYFAYFWKLGKTICYLTVLK
jgi:hypothetical protein